MSYQGPPNGPPQGGYQQPQQPQGQQPQGQQHPQGQHTQQGGYQQRQQQQQYPQGQQHTQQGGYQQPQQPQYPAQPQQQQGGLPANAPAGFALTNKPPQSLAAQAKSEIEKDYGGSGTTNIDWFDFPIPKNVGQITETVVRILPAKDPGDRFWSRSELHFGKELQADGELKNIVWDCTSIAGNKCPGLDKKIEFFTEAKALGQTHDNPGPERKMGFALSTKTRNYFNAIIYTQPQRHLRDENLFPAVIRGNKTFSDAVMNLEQYQGPISDWQWGRNLIVKVKRIGTEPYMVEYDIYAEGNPSQIEQQWWPILANIYDLDELVDPESPGDGLINFQRCWPNVFGAPPITHEHAPQQPAPQNHQPQLPNAPQGPQGSPLGQTMNAPQAPPGAPPFNSGQQGAPQGQFGGQPQGQQPAQGAHGGQHQQGQQQPQGAHGGQTQGQGFQGPFNPNTAPSGPTVDVPSEFGGPSVEDDVPF